MFDSMMLGFNVALTISNILYCAMGVTLGTVIGVLPGLGPVATISLLLPLTYSIPIESSIILLSGIYYGAMYGGSITSILVNLPGEAASVVTCLDGYQMARKGRAGAALGIAAIGSFVAGTVAIIGLNLFAPTVSRLAIKFGPPEYATLMVMGLTFITYLSTQSPLKCIVSALVGLLLACIGSDPEFGVQRLTFGSVSLLSGLDFAVIAMGLFGVGEIFHSLESSEETKIVTDRISQIWPTRDDLARSSMPIARGSVLGFLVGLLPGGGAVIASLLSYALEKRLSREPERFGAGAIEGVAGPESANNAAAGAAFIPLLTLGLPSNAVMALIFGALMIHGITPGPFLIREQPQLFWGVVVSMYIGNVLLLILNLPMVGVFVKLLRVRLSILAACVLIVTMIGVYSISNNVVDMWFLLCFGLLGYLMRKFAFEPGPLVLAFVLGPIMETAFRQSLIISGGDVGIFVSRPIALSFLIVAVLLVLTQIVGRRREPASA
ncbi:tripartite tricarboxylate transporter permease [Propionivibrio dicarboxylicus]|uniref:Putative tricarboxylic transport membrane protein n=1 Tax=Propionivibrio dicarboxylicus TaxID=83767 RepID=A0A1G8K1S9_9RHOO|nr:tripartite tricarboxylate transporter permease [Propionivibrio dicarboxylicus]SDI37436.1 putative tricarboxylic transport membrane protein [Propionivibrio dicarboxylicus]